MDKSLPLNWFRKSKLINRLSAAFVPDRIYILPTRHGLAFLVSLFFLFLIALSYGHSMAFAATFLMTSVLMSSALLTHLNLKDVSFSGTNIETAFRVDEYKRFKIYLKNKGPKEKMSLGLHKWNEEKIKKSDLVDIAPKGLSELSFLRPDFKIGTHEVRDLTIATGFPIGLFYTWKKFKYKMTIYVAPQAFDHLGKRPSISPQIAPKEKEQQFETVGLTDEGEFYEYQDFNESSDSWKKVDWKVYARRSLLLKRKQSQPLENVLSLDYSQLRGLDFNQRLEQLSFWVELCSQQGADFNLYLGEEKLLNLKGLEGKERALKALALFFQHSGGGNGG